ncbi:MFS transporter permease [Curtobacterium sp. MCBA15_004]|uniref:MFS transporter permease n=1 Tax=unclassified Curtobacterium TaxID=257496 RepID=UPI0008DCB858|nr:MFS transporter permease [Curtobacterium sp. MCBA15_004]WIA96213.1 MFS transporter permease [Curtobacterium sp. MCBA15_004]
MTSAWAGRRGSSLRRPRPRGVWIASGIGIVLVLAIALGAYLPLVGFLGGVTATTAGLVPFPFLRVTAVTLVGAVVVLALLLLALTRRHTVTTVLVVALTVLVSLAVTAYPVVTVAISSADRAGDVWPIVAELWQRFTG